MACCFSCYKQLFGEGQEFTYGLQEVGRYYRACVRLMEHWGPGGCPALSCRSCTKTWSTTLETQVRRILDFCDLPFEQACVNFHETERNIRDAQFRTGEATHLPQRHGTMAPLRTLAGAPQRGPGP